MFTWLTDRSVLMTGIILAILQGLAALPWLRAIDTKSFDRSLRNPTSLGSAVLIILGLGLALAWYLGYQGGSESLGRDGKIFGSILHLQILVDIFLFAPQLLILISPKAGAVAQAAFREGLRQPMFWLITSFAIMLMALAIVIPYYTFGDDYKMMKQIGFDICMLSAVLFGMIAASISIAEEIEGRTAITLMSKPINRRQFLVGKFLGILLASCAMTLVLGWFLNWALIITPEYDKINTVSDPMSEQARQEIVPRIASLVSSQPGTAARTFTEGSATWAAETYAHSVGLLLGFGQVMILVAIASALATRLPFVVNLVICLVVYFLGHLAPVVVEVTKRMRQEDTEGNTAIGLIQFLGNVFDTFLPALQFFNMSPAIVRETPLDLWAFTGYVITVFGYSILYTCIVLLVGLLLFEDRDLA